ncbi:OmpA family protein [Sinomicrobium sp. M5D2P9]
MKNKYIRMKKYILIGLCLIIGNIAFPQEAKKTRADKSYEDFGYIKSRELYENLLKKGYESKDLYSKLGDTYYYNALYAEALQHYEKVFSYEEETDPVYYYRYAKCLQAEGNYEEAGKVLEKFYGLIGQSGRQGNSLTEELSRIRENSGRYEITDVEINSKYADFGPAFGRDGQILFASARDTGIFVDRTHKWNKKPFLKLYTASANDDGTLYEPEQLKGDVNTKYHQSSPVITKDGETMYFTRNNFTRGNYGKDEEGTNHLKIYRAKYANGKWTEIEDLPINGEEFSTAHPALSPDDKYLYFASDRPGSKGMSDIFRVEITTDGGFGPVENLGEIVNTAGRETFPFIAEDGTLYLASDGHAGIGGLDVFAVINGPFGEEQVINVGEPVNSKDDDFGYIVDVNTRKGYFSSNRNEETGFDNIYTFLENAPLAIAAELCGHVRDIHTKEPLARTKVTLYDEEGEKKKEFETDDAGNFCVKVLAGKNYNTRYDKEEYQPHEEFVTKLEAGEKREVLIELERGDMFPGDDLAQKLNLNPIYFDFDKHNIREDAAKELAKVIQVMQQYQGMVIEVRSHTDSRGSDRYNLGLSDRRAKSTVHYIVEKGEISPDRVSGKGYGETELVNECANGVPCSREKHQLNRRSEFIIVEIRK